MRRIFIALLFALPAACGGAGTPATSDSNGTPIREPIAPHQFALIPCKPQNGISAPPCRLLAAGGKYFLMGAPEGALSNLLESEIALLDGVLLFNLLPDQIDGLDHVRNVTWNRGRSQALLVAGPEGTEAFTSGIDSAYEIPDAEWFALNRPPGGYDASLMKPLEVLPGSANGTLVVNTGDLVVRGFYAPSGSIVYQVEYSGLVASIGGSCSELEDFEFLSELSSSSDVSNCDQSDSPVYLIE